MNNKRESEQLRVELQPRGNKTNYLPWVLEGIGLLALITGLVWYFSRKENK